MLFNELKDLICPLYCFVGQVVAMLIANLQMFVKVISEVVGSVGFSAFNHLVIPTTMIHFHCNQTRHHPRVQGAHSSHSTVRLKTV